MSNQTGLENEFQVKRFDGQVHILAIDESDDMEVYSMSPLMAASLASALFDKAEQEGDDVDES